MIRVCTSTISRAALIAAAATLTTASAMAGGFAVREQSAMSQGASFAGAGASTALSSMFVNSAAVTTLGGLNVDSNISAILPEATITAQQGSTLGPGTPFANFFNQSTDIGRNAYVPSTYISYQLSGYDPKMFVGLGINSPFGLRTEPDKAWAGSQVGGSTRLFTVNFNPTIGYKFSDSLSVGVGAQFEYAKGVFKFASTSPTSAATYYEGTNVTAGATAGLMYTPTESTRIGLGYRSQMDHELQGSFTTDASVAGGLFSTPVRSKVDLRLPDIVNLSLNQALSPNLRLLATAEWSNWSRFNGLTITQESAGRVITKGGVPTGSGTVIGNLPGAWKDGYFFSGGLEYDVSRQLTVRAGGAYEISPVQDPTQRIISIPDADRIWASVGFSYNVSPTTALDFGYSHIFVDTAQIDRFNVTKQVHLVGSLDASLDIVSLGLRMKLN